MKVSTPHLLILCVSRVFLSEPAPHLRSNTCSRFPLRASRVGLQIYGEDEKIYGYDGLAIEVSPARPLDSLRSVSPAPKPISAYS